MKDKMNSGVYRIIHRESGKVYIGSSKNLRKRLWEHRNKLNKNQHENRFLQNAWLKYSEEAFDMEVILICDEKDNFMYEQKFMDFYKSYQEEFGYNISVTADGPRGYNMPEQAKEKIRRARLGQKGTPQMKAKMREIGLNRTFSEETKSRMSKAQKGVPKMSSEQKAAVSAFHKGKKQSPETIAKKVASRKITEDKRREAGIKRTAWNTGIPISDEVKAKLSKALTGREISEETKQKRKETRAKNLLESGEDPKEQYRKGLETKRLKKLKKEREIWWAGQSMMFEAQALLQNTNFNI